MYQWKYEVECEDHFPYGTFWIIFQVDLVAQGDSVYDIIDPADHAIMRSNLVPPASPDTGKVSMLAHSSASKCVSVIHGCNES